MAISLASKETAAARHYPADARDSELPADLRPSDRTFNKVYRERILSFNLLLPLFGEQLFFLVFKFANYGDRNDRGRLRETAFI